MQSYCTAVATNLKRTARGSLLHPTCSIFLCAIVKVQKTYGKPRTATTGNRAYTVHRSRAFQARAPYTSIPKNVRSASPTKKLNAATARLRPAISKKRRLNGSPLATEM